MACPAMHLWTFSGLVGAFLDLAIAYLLLCASTVAFFTSKFLDFFGLCLPCPCDGLFGNPNGNYCLQRLLVDCPTEKVSSVQLSVKTKFPFDSILAEDQNYHFNMKVVRERSNNVDGFVELEGEASCSSLSDARKSKIVIGRDSVPRNENGVGFGVTSLPGVKEGRFDLKGKGVMNQRPRGGIRRRRKGGVDYGRYSSVSSYDPPCGDVQSVPRSSSSINKEGNETIGGSLLPVDSGVDAHCFHYNGEAPTVMRLGERALHDFELNGPLDENKPTEKKASVVEELRSNTLGELGYDSDEKNAIGVLEQALEEEHAARTALYLELEKERSAAASAADEAMAMILRLQEEKASIEMEARQYQRIIEEKSAYDAEEMNIFKEILVRRERETHFLEKEVEAYRKMIYLGNEQLEGDAQDMVDTRRQVSPDLGEDPVLMLHQLSESIDKKKMLKNRSSDNEATSIDKQKCALAFGEELLVRGCNEDADFPNNGDLEKNISDISMCSNNGNQELQEKEMVSISSQPKEGQRLGKVPLSYKSSSSQEHNLLEKTISLVGEEQEPNDNANRCQEMEPKTVETHNETEIYIPHDGENLEKHGKDSYLGSIGPCNLMFDKEPRLHDVHVVDDECNLFNEVNGNKVEQLSVNNTSKGHRTSDFPSEGSAIQRIDSIRDCPSTSRFDTESEINRSSSDMTSGLPPIGSWGRSLLSDLRRNSMSALDNERLKIDSEVGSLRERLRIVQEGREKLNLSMEHREREKMQLQLLEDIARQLREIRQLTEPGKAVRQSSLPPPSSQVMSKKRRCRSLSLGVQKNS